MKQTLTKALKSAGEIQLRSFQSGNKTVEKENISSVVTEIDIKSEKAILDIIESEYPDHNILSEEIGLKNKNSKYTWVIDPLDGTSNYAAGLPWFGVLMALFEENTPILSGAYLPVSNKLYVAEKGKGAFCNDKKLNVKEQPLNQSLVVFSIDFCKDLEYLDKGIGIYKYLVQNSRNVRSTNSLVDFLYIAEEKFAGCVNMFTCIWDIAATYLILREAGGDMKGLDTNDIEFFLDQENLHKNYPVVAGTKSFFEDIINVIA